MKIIQKTGSKVVHHKKYKLEIMLEKIITNNPEEVSKMLVEHKLKLYLGAMGGIEHAFEYVDLVSKELKNNLVAALIFGGVARGLKDEHLPRDIDVMIIVKKGVEVGTKPQPRIDPLIYEEDKLTTETMLSEKHRAEASFQRLALSLPILVLHGKKHVQNLREHARKFLRVEDFKLCIENKAQDLKADLEKKGEKIPPFNELCMMVADDIGFPEEVLDAMKFSDRY